MNNNKLPLAARMRPISMDEFLGQEEVVGKDKMLRKAIASDKLPSMIFWGPPGSGKTTLAFIIAQATHADFVQISATASGKNELREIIKRAEQNLRLGQKTILFIDEIHRWNKTQQDALLPHVERGTIVLIGATTENPSFEVVGALLSRCMIFVLTKLSREQIAEIIKRAIKDKGRGLGEMNIKLGKKEIEMLASMSNGDARTALNVLEYASSIPLPASPLGKGRGVELKREITSEMIKQAFQKSHLLYDKDGEEHYNIISALHKSMRGGEANAALYWLARMLEAGEDPLFIARRLIRFASEDIGLANSKALEQAVAAYSACHYIGMPECNVILAQAVVYMAKCQKSNELYTAYQKAQNDVKEYGNLGVPLHLRNAPTKLMKNLGYGKDYKYSPDYDYQENQEYLPPELKGRKYLD